jgi:hypothetical protein
VPRTTKCLCFIIQSLPPQLLHESHTPTLQHAIFNQALGPCSHLDKVDQPHSLAADPKQWMGDTEALASMHSFKHQSPCKPRNHSRKPTTTHIRH